MVITEAINKIFKHSNKRGSGTMLYLIKNEVINGVPYHYIFETNTESTLPVTTEYLEKLIKEIGLTIENVYLKDEKIQVKKWPHHIRGEHRRFNQMVSKDGAEFILLAKINDNKFKLVNQYGGVPYMDAMSLKKEILASEIANCSYEEKDGIKIYKSMDTYKIKEDIKYAQLIKSKYDQFLSKSMALGDRSKLRIQDRKRAGQDNTVYR